MTDCPETGALVETALDRIATQYRESPRLIGLIRALLSAAEAPTLALCPVPDFFDLDTAAGDQLTIIGKWLGWPREHCRGTRAATFGFTAGCTECELDRGPILAGFCEGIWDGCPDSEFASYTFTDDALYRRFLKARRAQIAGDYSRPALLSAARALFDDDGLVILRERPGTATLILSRAFTAGERQILHLYGWVLPVAPGIALDILSRPDDGLVFGFGDGWGGFCTGLWA